MSLFTKRHYEKFASELGLELYHIRSGDVHGTIDTDENVFWDIVNMVSTMLRHDNNSYDEKRFYAWIESEAGQFEKVS